MSRGDAAGWERRGDADQGQGARAQTRPRHQGPRREDHVHQPGPAPPRASRAHPGSQRRPLFNFHRAHAHDAASGGEAMSTTSALCEQYMNT